MGNENTHENAGKGTSKGVMEGKNHPSIVERKQGVLKSLLNEVKR